MKNLVKYPLLLSLLASSHIALSQQNFESPAANSEQSGIGIIRGWACDAKQVKMVVDDEHELELPYGGSRGDTKSACGDTDNGYAATIFYGLYGTGEHTIDLYIDDKKVSSRTFTVASPTNKFLKDVDATFAVNNFPTAGQTTELMWSEAHQNFVIVDSHPTDTDWAMTVIEKNRTSTTMSFSTADKPAVITIKSPFNEPINVEIFSEDYDETKPVHIIPVGADSGGLITLSPAGESSFNRAEEDMPIFLTLD